MVWRQELEAAGHKAATVLKMNVGTQLTSAFFVQTYKMVPSTFSVNTPGQLTRSKDSLTGMDKGSSLGDLSS